MTCHQVQTNLSLFLYGDLDFAAEEALEEHLAECPACQLALDREKAWHANLNAERADVPLDLLARCRSDLGFATRAESSGKTASPFWTRMAAFFAPSTNRWSERLALASLFLFLGLGLSHLESRFGVFSRFTAPSDLAEASLLGRVQVRDVRPIGDGKVRLSLDQIQRGEMVGSLSDEAVRRLLLSTITNSADAGLRVDSVELLRGQNGPEVRDVLLQSATKDPNAAVRLKALEGLRPFRTDDETRSTLLSVIQYDDNSGVRSEAMEVLVPSGTDVRLSPDVAGAFQQIIRSEHDDDFIRLRCLQILQTASASRIY
ncbi:MAG: HEAT repeat domain-containing protein [Bryobacteraceae bacterium]